MPPAAFKHKLIQEYPALQLNGWKVGRVALGESQLPASLFSPLDLSLGRVVCFVQYVLREHVVAFTIIQRVLAQLWAPP
jgi:hypothetical protein